MPDGLDAFAEVVEDVAALDAAAGWEETADNAGDVATDVERLGIIDSDTLYTETEATNAWKNDSLSILSILSNILRIYALLSDAKISKITESPTWFPNYLRIYASFSEIKQGKTSKLIHFIYPRRKCKLLKIS